MAARSAGEFEKKEVEESRSKAAQYLSTKSGQIQTNPEGWVRPHLPRVPRWIGNTYLDDFGRDSPAFLNSTGDM